VVCCRLFFVGSGVREDYSHCQRYGFVEDLNRCWGFEFKHLFASGHGSRRRKRSSWVHVFGADRRSGPCSWGVFSVVSSFQNSAIFLCYFAFALRFSSSAAEQSQESAEREKTESMRTQVHAMTNQYRSKETICLRSRRRGDRNLSQINATIRLILKSISISVIVEKPVRREFLNISIDRIESTLSVTPRAGSCDFNIGDIQIDTFSETAPTPVAMYAIRDQESQDTPLLEFILIQELHPEATYPHYAYIAARLLELSIAIDSSTLQLLILDFGSDFAFFDGSVAKALHEPQLWVEQFSRNVLLPEKQLHVDICQSLIEARAPKVYIENLSLHPVKLTLSFMQTTLPRREATHVAHALAVGVLSYIPAIATLDKVKLKMNSLLYKT
jgi:hypothetical protein